jgi:hypothetical protein
MIVPVKNIVEQIDLTSDDVLLPLLECVVNSIIGIQQLPTNEKERKIQIQSISYKKYQILQLIGIKNIR